MLFFVSIYLSEQLYKPNKVCSTKHIAIIGIKKWMVQINSVTAQAAGEVFLTVASPAHVPQHKGHIYSLQFIISEVIIIFLDFYNHMGAVFSHFQ